MQDPNLLLSMLDRFDPHRQQQEALQMQALSQQLALAQAAEERQAATHAHSLAQAQQLDPIQAEMLRTQLAGAQAAQPREAEAAQLAMAIQRQQMEQSGAMGPIAQEQARAALAQLQGQNSLLPLQRHGLELGQQGQQQQLDVGAATLPYAGPAAAAQLGAALLAQQGAAQQQEQAARMNPLAVKGAQQQLDLGAATLPYAGPTAAASLGQLLAEPGFKQQALDQQGRHLTAADAANQEQNRLMRQENLLKAAAAGVPGLEPNPEVIAAATGGAFRPKGSAAEFMAIVNRGDAKGAIDYMMAHPTTRAEIEGTDPNAMTTLAHQVSAPAPPATAGELPGALKYQISQRYGSIGDEFMADQFAKPTGPWDLLSRPFQAVGTGAQMIQAPFRAGFETAGQYGKAKLKKMTGGK